MSFVQSLLDRLMARAARLSSEAGDPDRPKRAAPMSAAEAEATAVNRSIEALNAGDVPKALYEVELFADYSTNPETLALQGHLLLVSGSADRARQVLERALRANPSHPGVLEGLAALHKHQGNAVDEFGVRMRLLRSVARYTPRQVIDTFTAMLHASAQRTPVKGELQMLVRMFEQVTPLASREEQLEFAECLFPIKSVRPNAQALVEANLPRAAAFSLRTVQRSDIGNLPAQHVLHRHEEPDALLPGTTLRAVELQEASVLPGVQWSPWLPQAGHVLHGFITSRWITARENAASPLVLQNPNEMLLRVPTAGARRIEETAVLIGSNANYYHFVVEHLSRLAVLQELGVDVKDPLWIVGEHVLPYQLAYLRLLGVDEDRLVRVGTGDVLEFRHLVAPYPLARGGRQISPLIAKWARETIAPRAGVTPAAPGTATRKLYLSRARAARRKVANEDLLLEWLRSEGYECIHPEDLDVQQQIQLFSQACEMVSPAGAALTNMIYMPPGARVTILYNSYLPPGVESLYFDYLARASGHTFAAVPGAPQKITGAMVLDADFEVPLAALQAALQAAPQSPAATVAAA